MGKDKLKDIDSAQFELIKQILEKNLPGKEVWAYGSRVKLNAKKFSDLDLVVIGASDKDIAHTDENFEESSLPFRVSLMQWEKLPDDFIMNIKSKYVVIQMGI